VRAPAVRDTRRMAMHWRGAPGVAEVDLRHGGVTMVSVISKTTAVAILASLSLVVFADVPPLTGAAETPGVAPDASAVPAAVSPPEDLAEIVIAAPEARYVSPTRRDRIGRIWAPVFINDQGPFRLVLDTGASRSCVIARVAARLNLTPDPSASIRLQAVTGSATVPTVRVNSLLIGDLLITGSKLPIIPDALGGAEGILGNEGLTDRRVYIDFRHDIISITHSHNRAAPPGFYTVPFTLQRGRLLTVDAWLGRVRAKAIIDTGGQTTVANLALRDALMRKYNSGAPEVDHIEGVTTDIQEGEDRRAPSIEFGPIEIHTERMTFADVRIFEYWKLTQEPALLIGMDALGLLDTLIIDYHRNELQLRMREY
jgi:predicted aspartyl protease